MLLNQTNEEKPVATVPSPSVQQPAIPVSSPSGQLVKALSVQPQKTNALTERVAESPPILPADPYPVPVYVRASATPAPAPLVPEFTRKYSLRGNATGLTVNVTKGPLLVSYDIKPLYDCLDKPESCRGSMAKSINRPYFILTVRNLTTQEIVAEDGYAREYSSEKTNRTVKIFGEGRYHLTLTGNYLDVTLSITTGDSPRTVATPVVTIISRQVQSVPPELLLALREARGAA